jgi:hypothetical protein
MILRRVLFSLIGGICYAQVPQTVFLPPVNLAATETARIGIMSSAAAYVGDTFLAPCNAAVTFYDSHGSAVGDATNFTIADSRQIFSAELPFALTGGSGSSTSISARIALTPNSVAASLLTPPIPPCAVAFSLETRDTATGVTHSLVTGWAAEGDTLITGNGVVSVSRDVPVFAPQPAPNIVLPPIGLAASETAEVNLINTAPTFSSGVAASCSGSVAFYDVAGSALGTSSSFTIGTGQIVSLKLPYDATGAAAAGETIVRAEIALAAPPSTIAVLSTALSTPPCELGFSLETSDTATGISHALVSGTTAQGVSNKAPRSGLGAGGHR